MPALQPFLSTDSCSLLSQPFNATECFQGCPHPMGLARTLQVFNTGSGSIFSVAENEPAIACAAGTGPQNAFSSSTGSSSASASSVATSGTGSGTSEPLGAATSSSCLEPNAALQVQVSWDGCWARLRWKQ